MAMLTEQVPFSSQFVDEVTGAGSASWATCIVT